MTDEAFYAALDKFNASPQLTDLERTLRLQFCGASGMSIAEIMELTDDEFQIVAGGFAMFHAPVIEE